MSEHSKIRFDLLENGFDFISSGLSHILNDDKPNELKYAILHLSAGVELLLKDILRKEHWTLIFDNVNNADYSNLTNGQFKSVDFETLLTRLINICELDLTQKDLGILRQLKSLRNKVEHFEFEENTNAIRSLGSKVLSVLLNVIHEYILPKDNTGTTEEYVDILREKFKGFNEFVKLRSSQIKNEIDSLDKYCEIEQCPKCTQAALVLNDDLKCLFCFYSDNPQNVAELYAENILGESAYIAATDGGEFPVYDCIHCGDDNCYVDKGEDGYVCFSCYETDSKTHIKECPSCGQLYETHMDDDSGICDYCVDARWRDD